MRSRGSFRAWACWLPLLAVVPAGVFIGDHWNVAALALSGLFFLFLVPAIRASRKNA